MDLGSFLLRFNSALQLRGLVCACQGAGWEELLKAEISPACRTSMLSNLCESQAVKSPFYQSGMVFCDFQVKEGRHIWQIQVALGDPSAPAMCMGFHRSSATLSRAVTQPGAQVSHAFSIQG